jgi:prepilin-type N-terminal cleavage/methylation domain-containing protein
MPNERTIWPTQDRLRPGRPNDALRVRLPDQSAASAASSQRAHHLHRGFTLLEVLVALVITLMALDVLSGGVVTSLRTARDTATWSRAISRAESHLAELTDPRLSLGERKGDEGDGFRWRTRVAFLGSAPAPDVARGGLWAGGTGLYAVSVAIFWRDAGRERSFVLDSARLGPVPATGS